MKELKFRRWDKNNKRFAYMELFNKGTYQITDFPDGGNGLGDYEMFTGLYDKNGEPVWEGDIVALKTKGGNNLKVIVWIETGACFGWIDGNNDSWPDGFTGFIDEYEVIGNIHQNPELIKGAS
jgi:hypothetical protein